MILKKQFLTLVASLLIISLVSCAAIFIKDKPIEVQFSDNSTVASEPVVFSNEINYQCKYIEDSPIPYALFIPSTAKQSESIPLIIWLHGSGEVGCDKEEFLDSGLPKILQNWQTEKFNAYILCPHLSDEVGFDKWNNQEVLALIKRLIKIMILDYNVDRANIVIAGTSLGAFGAEYMAYHLPSFFSRLMVVSSFETYVNPKDIQIPGIGFVGQVEYGEDQYSEKYMLGKFAKAFGKEHVFQLKTSHHKILKSTFELDQDMNNRSDAIEWMLGISK